MAFLVECPACKEKHPLGINTCPCCGYDLLEVRKNQEVNIYYDAGNGIIYQAGNKVPEKS